MPRTSRRRSPAAVVCPACGSDKAHVIQRVEQFHEPDVQGEFRDEITKCDECGEEVFTFEQAEASAKAYAAAVARARNSPSVERLFELRMNLKWSQAQMEEAFGVGPKTWGRWERGTVPLTGPAARLLWFAENDRLNFIRMVEQHTRKPAKQAKVAGSIGLGQQASGFTAANRIASRTGQVPSNGSSDSGNGGAV
jgi:putative zinc finger/helix-turn-helix YgiT family protein